VTKKKSPDPLLDVLQDLLIVQLVQAGVGSGGIRRIARVQMSRVNRISKVLRKRKKGKGSTNG
jgi:hypothetical protein